MLDSDKCWVVTGLLAVILTCTSVQATESDIAKEQRWAEQVIDGLLDGDELWLDDGAGHEFFGILTKGDDSDRAVILVHGIGVHPNWPDVIYPLREALLEKGITSLSIQMPILPNEAEATEYLPLFAEVPGRLAATVSHLQEAGYTKISIVAHSMGAAMMAHSLAIDNPVTVDAVVLIGMGSGIEDESGVEALREIKVPVLDLYGSEDLPHVMESADSRAAAGNSRTDREYSQVKVDGANHFFQGTEAHLVENALGWLEQF